MLMDPCEISCSVMLTLPLYWKSAEFFRCIVPGSSRMGSPASRPRPSLPLGTMMRCRVPALMYSSARLDRPSILKRAWLTKWRPSSRKCPSPLTSSLATWPLGTTMTLTCPISMTGSSTCLNPDMTKLASFTKCTPLSSRRGLPLVVAQPTCPGRTRMMLTGPLLMTASFTLVQLMYSKFGAFRRCMPGSNSTGLPLSAPSPM
mmetsp:Transcript_17297/g.49177  ORF Transcript_17297/g.49177 Transcript_17297/m.49177 type:complete len:203 (+) Transcript_17297:574-1182(+)